MIKSILLPHQLRNPSPLVVDLVLVVLLEEGLELLVCGDLVEVGEEDGGAVLVEDLLFGDVEDGDLLDRPMRILGHNSDQAQNHREEYKDPLERRHDDKPP